ncbi:DUF6133 family protein [Desulfosporosinus fructosivorans]|uniref:DUF6133 family protein n=1 Tax=Desulfosporosinus fructosivorans TaxID=2018669 RepID=UPI001FB060AF|nr:DUF6133 family protein [Desulfosporosinus fructosivorans]
MILQCVNKKIYLLLRRLELYRVQPKDTKAIKILLAFVLRALLLAGLYALFLIKAGSTRWAHCKKHPP